MSNSNRVILYLLVDYTCPIFVGLVWEQDLNRRIAEHRREIPVPFAVQIIGTFPALYQAQHEARILIKRYLTNIMGFNKTDFGDLDNRPLLNKGGYKWNNGVDVRTNPHFDSWRHNIGATMSKQARLKNYSDRLPYHAGDAHPNKLEHNREKIKKAAQGRRRYYFEDGSWTWQYAADHPLAFRNRENGIPNLQIEKTA